MIFSVGQYRFQGNNVTINNNLLRLTTYIHLYEEKPAIISRLLLQCWSKSLCTFIIISPTQFFNPWRPVQVVTPVRNDGDESFQEQAPQGSLTRFYKLFPPFFPT